MFYHNSFNLPWSVVVENCLSLRNKKTNWNVRGDLLWDTSLLIWDQVAAEVRLQAQLLRCSQQSHVKFVCTWKGEELLAFREYFLHDPVWKQPACLAAYRMDEVMWNKMHFGNNGSICAGMKDFLLISITPQPSWLGSSDTQMSWDPYILSVGLGTVSNLCRLWAVVRVHSHLRAYWHWLFWVGFLYSVKKYFISVAS